MSAASPKGAGDLGRNIRRVGPGLAGVLLAAAITGCAGGANGVESAGATPTVSSSSAPSLSMSPGPQVVTATASPVATATIAATIGHGQFGLTGSMSVPRSQQTATLLRDGRVLITGGSGDNGAELYDPPAGKFGPTGSLNVVRMGGHTATLLRDGRVLIAGGRDNSASQNALASAELYDPGTGEFSPTGSMSQPRAGQTATLLQDGRVLVVGGFNSSHGSLASAELYDPATGTFGPTGSPRNPRSGQTATLLADGRVLIAGGTGTGAYDDTTPASAELYDPTSGSFSTTGPMTAGRWGGHSATLLKNGRVLIEGGNASAIQEVPLASAELYDPTTGRFIETGSMAVARDTGSSTLLLDGRVLVAGGDDRAAELYDPQTGRFGGTGLMAVARDDHTATLLPDGRVLFAGGYVATASTPGDDVTAELYQP
jgi:hypothetical protein